MVVLSSFCHPDTPIHLEQRNTRVILDKKDLGLGTLFISERTLSWKEGEIGFSLSYPNISLHAISTDPNLYPTECIYVMIDAHVQIPGIEYEDAVEDPESDGESDADISELILVPEESSAISTMYEALKECQALNPDPDDMEDEDEIYEDADEEMEPSTEDIGAGGDNEMENLVNQLRNTVEINYDRSNGDHLNEEIFEDAD